MEIAYFVLGVNRMGIFELLLIALSLSMDAFAVSLCKGLCMKKMNYRYAAVIAAFFGGFQAAMPILGWAVGRRFQQDIAAFDHWIAFVLLVFIGGKMVVEAVRDNEEYSCGPNAGRLNIRELLALSVATSIDALAVGVTFAFLKVSILFSAALIGCTTFLLSFVGVALGNRFGLKYKNKAEIAGGVVLILIGSKILVEHLFAA